MDLLVRQGSISELWLRGGLASRAWDSLSPTLAAPRLSGGGLLCPTTVPQPLSQAQAGQAVLVKQPGISRPCRVAPGEGRGPLTGLHSVGSSSLKILAASRCRLQNPAP